MYPTAKRFALLGALASTFAVAAPAATASTASAAPAAGPAGLAFPGLFPFIPDGATANGQLVVGPTATGAIIITTAPTSFINTNNQTSGGGNWSTGQVLAP
jgi:hypothetical protein